MKTFAGHFDGKVIVLDEVADFKPNAKVRVIAEGEGQALTTEFAALSERAFEKIWDNPLDADYDSI